MPLVLETSPHSAARLRSLAAEDDVVRLLPNPEEPRQHLLDPGFSMLSGSIFKRERGQYERFVELLKSRHLVRFRTWRREETTEDGTKEDVHDPGLSTIELVVQMTAARPFGDGRRVGHLESVIYLSR